MANNTCGAIKKRSFGAEKNRKSKTPLNSTRYKPLEIDINSENRENVPEYSDNSIDLFETEVTDLTTPKTNKISIENITDVAISKTEYLANWLNTSYGKTDSIIRKSQFQRSDSFSSVFSGLSLNESEKNPSPICDAKFSRPKSRNKVAFKAKHRSFGTNAIFSNNLLPTSSSNSSKSNNGYETGSVYAFSKPKITKRSRGNCERKNNVTKSPVKKKIKSNNVGNESSDMSICSTHDGLDYNKLLAIDDVASYNVHKQIIDTSYLTPNSDRSVSNLFDKEHPSIPVNNASSSVNNHSSNIVNNVTKSSNPTWTSTFTSDILDTPSSYNSSNMSLCSNRSTQISPNDGLDYNKHTQQASNNKHLNTTKSLTKEEQLGNSLSVSSAISFEEKSSIFSDVSIWKKPEVNKNTSQNIDSQNSNDKDFDSQSWGDYIKYIKYIRNWSSSQPETVHKTAKPVVLINNMVKNNQGSNICIDENNERVNMYEKENNQRTTKSVTCGAHNKELSQQDSMLQYGDNKSSVTYFNELDASCSESLRQYLTDTDSNNFIFSQETEIISGSQDMLSQEIMINDRHLMNKQLSQEIETGLQKNIREDYDNHPFRVDSRKSKPLQSTIQSPVSNICETLYTNQSKSMDSCKQRQNQNIKQVSSLQTNTNHQEALVLSNMEDLQDFEIYSQCCKTNDNRSQKILDTIPQSQIEYNISTIRKLNNSQVSCSLISKIPEDNTVETAKKPSKARSKKLSSQKSSKLSSDDNFNSTQDSQSIIETSCDIFASTQDSPLTNVSPTLKTKKAITKKRINKSSSGDIVSSTQLTTLGLKLKTRKPNIKKKITTKKNNLKIGASNEVEDFEINNNTKIITNTALKSPLLDCNKTNGDQSDTSNFLDVDNPFPDIDKVLTDIMERLSEEAKEGKENEHPNSLAQCQNFNNAYSPQHSIMSMDSFKSLPITKKISEAGEKNHKVKNLKQAPKSCSQLCSRNKKTTICNTQSEKMFVGASDSEQTSQTNLTSRTHRKNPILKAKKRIRKTRMPDPMSEKYTDYTDSRKSRSMQTNNSFLLDHAKTIRNNDCSQIKSKDSNTPGESIQKLDKLLTDIVGKVSQTSKSMKQNKNIRSLSRNSTSSNYTPKINGTPFINANGDVELSLILSNIHSENTIPNSQNSAILTQLDHVHCNDYRPNSQNSILTHFDNSSQANSQNSRVLQFDDLEPSQGNGSTYSQNCTMLSQSIQQDIDNNQNTTQLDLLYPIQPSYTNSQSSGIYTQLTNVDLPELFETLPPQNCTQNSVYDFEDEPLHQDLILSQSTTPSHYLRSQNSSKVPVYNQKACKRTQASLDNSQVCTSLNVSRYRFDANIIDLTQAFSDVTGFIKCVFVENRIADRNLNFEEYLSQHNNLPARKEIEVIHNIQRHSVKVLSASMIKLGAAVDSLAKDVSILYDGSLPPEETDYNIRARLILRIEDIFKSLHSDVENKRPLILKIRNFSSWANTVFANNRLLIKPENECRFVRINERYKNSKNKFNLLIYLLRKVYNLLKMDTRTTKREIYYQIVKFVRKQEQVNSAVDALCCLLHTTPWNLGLLSTSKGLVYGDIKVIFSEEETLNCNVRGGSLIPNDLKNMVRIESGAAFILLVEKDAIFQKLLEEDLPNKLARRFILITGKGYGDISTRRFLVTLWKLLSIPIFVLADADPYGIEIMLCYRFGSLNNCFISQELAIPNLRWLGVHPSEIDPLNIQHSTLTEKDAHRIRCILTRPYIQKGGKIQLELLVMLKKRKKAEIEGLLVCDKMLSMSYLPNKLHTKDFI